ncbi:ABC transporter transmembrane domain-containing protein [Methyloceanibacter sp. wino2]|uniref:ABC transporter transmembrane domain-containing protein n=1 Tax=Methyloceanibacter sp. wino2 TaxID=2170729 RepID=UPI000D3E1FE2|nr:ABC transporter transmembrane domain-containing protein [Methyloceanibacter sp. wino2]
MEPEQTGKPKRVSLRPLGRLKPYLLRHKWMLLAALVSLVVAAGAMLALPLALRRMIDLGFSGIEPELVDVYFGTLVGVGALLAIASAARFYCVNWLGERVVADIRTDVFKHLTGLSPAFYEVSHSGEVMSRLTADTTQVKAAAGTAVSQAMRNLLLVVGSVVMMIVTSPKLSLAVLIAIPLIVLPLVAYGRSVRARSRYAQDTLAEASAYASESLSQVKVLQAFTNERAATSRFRRAMDRAFEAANDRAKARAGLTAIAMFLVFLSVVGVLWYGAQDVLSGSMTGGTLGQFVLYAVFAAAAVGGLSDVWGEVAQAAGAAERLGELLEAESEIQSPPHPTPMPEPGRGEIAFDDVSFAYPLRPDIAALDGVSFTVKPGERVALVGPSGAGKTTIFALLLRFYDPKSGTVRVDDVPVDMADLHDLRSRFAMVPQETALFADTVAANIAYGAETATPAQIEAAAKAAFAHDFITELPEGYETQLGEGGVTLSGGQRQRIAIARAVLRDAPILLLDEATSALDTTNETLVQKALDKVMDGRTTLVIAHRLSTVVNADRILVFDRGELVEEGTHQQLIAKSGLYARLASLQFAPDAAE